MTNPSESLAYKEALKELHEIVKSLETAQDLDIDTLPALTARAAELLVFCQKRLTVVETEVSKVLATLEPDGDGQSPT